jgi:hypothetical protein
MAADNTNDRLGSADQEQFNPAWDWKGSYVSSIAGAEEGLERFSQFSASPDTTLLFAGPARFTGLSGDASLLTPIGLADQIGIQANPSLARLFEVGSNRSFFTRGKTAYAMSLGRMLCDTKSLMAALTANSYRPTTIPTSPAGAQSPNPDIQMNIDSEIFGVPFGLFLLMKTKGGGTVGEGKILTAMYLEYCMLASHSFSLASASPVIVEQVGIEFDRMLPVSLN